MGVVDTYGPYFAIKLAMTKIGGQFSQPSEAKKVYKRDGRGSLADHVLSTHRAKILTQGNGDVKKPLIGILNISKSIFGK